MTARQANSQPSRAILAGIVAAGLVPPCLVLWILWLAPLGDLEADRAAMAARDFTDLWAAGRLATEHAFAILYDPARLTGFLRMSFGPGMPAQIWPYPPPTLLLAALAAKMPLLPGFVLYTAAGLAVLGWALRLGFRSPWACAAILLSPAVAENALAGQNGALTAAILFAGLLCLPTRPLLSGVLLGLLVLKPQLGLMVPICLVAGRHWRPLLAAGLTGLILASASAAIFGSEAWTGFLIDARPEITAYFQASWTGSASQRMFASVFVAMRALGADLTGAYAAQAVVTAIAASLVWTAWRGPVRSDRAQVALTMVATLVASPWTHDYDMPSLAIAIGLLLPEVWPRQRPILALAWLWPGIAALVPLPAGLAALSLLSMLMVVSQVTLAIGREGRRSLRPCA